MLLSFRKKNDFDWQCPACLFSHLPLLDIVNDNDLLSEGSSVNCVDSLPLPIDAFQPGLRVVHQNVQGFSSKMPEIAEWLHEGLHLPLILCCSETWLSRTDIVPSMDGFTLYCSPPLTRRDKPASFLPGSCMFVSSTVSPEHPLICEEVEQMCTLLNVVCCIVTCRHHRVAVVTVYRSPSIPGAACIAELRSVLLQLSSSAHYILMAGDFNINLLSFN